MKKRSDRSKRAFSAFWKRHRRTVLALSTITQLFCSLGAFAALCKKQKKDGSARVLAFIGSLAAVTGLALLCTQKQNPNRFDEDDEDTFAEPKSRTSHPTFSSAAHSAGLQKRTKSVRDLFTDAKPFSKNEKNTGTNSETAPSNVTVIIPGNTRACAEKERAEREEQERAIRERERAEREERMRAEEQKREAERKDAQNRLDEAIRILKNAAESEPSDESEHFLEKELSVSSDVVCGSCPDGDVSINGDTPTDDEMPTYGDVPNDCGVQAEIRDGAACEDGAICSESEISAADDTTCDAECGTDGTDGDNVLFSGAIQDGETK